MAERYLSDYARGYDYARRRYGELMAGFDRAMLLDLAAALARTDGDNAELARGMAAGLAELAQAKKNEG